jgi:hypothetical protein
MVREADDTDSDLWKIGGKQGKSRDEATFGGSQKRVTA